MKKLHLPYPLHFEGCHS